MNEVIDTVVKRAERDSARRTYKDENGVECCAVCGEPVSEYIEAFGKYLPVRCACYDREEAARKRKEQVRATKSAYRDSVFYDPGYARCTFASDNSQGSEVSKICRAYVDCWDKMEAGNYGLLMLGSIGTGKSFYAASIVNALVNKGVSSAMVSTSRIISMTDNGRNTQELIKEMNRVRLFVLDDLGAERDTEFALEQLEMIVDARNISGRPLIVTTNYSKEELDDLKDRRKARIFDRIKEMCDRPVILTGASRRAENAKRRARECRKILGV